MKALAVMEARAGLSMAVSGSAGAMEATRSTGAVEVTAAMRTAVVAVGILGTVEVLVAMEAGARLSITVSTVVVDIVAAEAKTRPKEVSNEGHCWCHASTIHRYSAN